MNWQQELIRHYGPGEGKALYRYIMEECFSLSQTDILLGKDSEISANDQLKVQEIARRLLKNEPIQYILGVTDFMGHRFRTRPGVLIPRVETAQLVTTIAKELAGTRADILDIGTGSGCIAISLALAGHNVTAMDISSEALQIARENAHELNAQVEFLHEDILSAEASDRKWNVIVSNPPYVTESEKQRMQPNVLDYEPHTALFVPDSDPLLFYRAIADYATEHLTKDGTLYFEINDRFAHETAQMLLSKGYTDIRVTKDQYEKERFLTAHTR